MSKLFSYSPDFLNQLAPWLRPCSNLASPLRIETSDAEQVLALERLGYACVWDIKLAERLERLGAVLAHTRASDGTNWLYARAAHPSDRLARWARTEDSALVALVQQALDAQVDPEVAALTLARLATFSADEVAALEAVIRLGTPAAVERYLEQGGSTW